MLTMESILPSTMGGCDMIVDYFRSRTAKLDDIVSLMIVKAWGDGIPVVVRGDDR